MAKEALKGALLKSQEGVCALSGSGLKPVLALTDTDRIVPKADGGIYADMNTRLVDPVAHMRRHGTYRERPESLAELKAVFDDRVQVMRLALKINNQILAYERRTDDRHPETEAFLQEQLVPVRRRLGAIDGTLARLIVAHDDPVSQATLAVPGVGPITTVALTVYVDLGKAAHASSLWSYVGIDKPSHERYEKGVVGGGNKTLRTVLWNTVSSMMRQRDNPYRAVYDAVKTRLASSKKVVKSRNTEGKLVEVEWQNAKPSHRHGAALRSMMKHFLADYWRVGRSLRGLPVSPLYAESMLGHEHIVPTLDRGWPL
jgi:hypothetical protein